MGGRNR